MFSMNPKHKNTIFLVAYCVSICIGVFMYRSIHVNYEASYYIFNDI